MIELDISFISGKLWVTPRIWNNNLNKFMPRISRFGIWKAEPKHPNLHLVLPLMQSNFTKKADTKRLSK